MKKGFRVPPQNSKKQQIRDVETEVKNVEMASRLSQMMIQQLMQNMKSMSQDLGNALNQLYELQYKYTALQKHLNLPTEALNELANQQRLVDFNDAAVKQDAKDSLIEATEVGAESTVTLTSEAKDETGADAGIFRSRIKLSESGVPDLITGLTGKKVGDKVAVNLNGLEHTVELLSIRNPTEVQPTLEATH